MKYENPTYQFPEAITKALEDGRKTSIDLLSEATNNSNRNGWPVALEHVFTSVCAMKRGLVRHFRRESIFEYQSLIVKEFGFQAACSLIVVSVETDACAWALAQKMKDLSPKDIDAIKADYFKHGDKVGRKLSRILPVAVRQYGPSYPGDKKIRDLFFIPGMLSAEEDPQDCVKALAAICSPS